MQILLIEDEIKLAQAVSKGLSRLGYQVNTAHSVEEGRGLLSNSEYDLIISDIVMPGQSGLELLAEIRDKGIQTPVLLLTALGQIEDKETGFDLGADDYLTKPFEFRELSARIKALLRRGKTPAQPSEPKILKYEGLELHLDAREAWREGRRINLTPKEFSLLEYFMNNPGRVISKHEIVQKVWDLHFDPGTNLVEVYMNFLRKKVEKGFTQKMFHTMVRSGYMLRAEKE